MTEPTTPATRYQVVCVDGKIRHAEPFATAAEADTWAEWGHACVADHTVYPVRTLFTNVGCAVEVSGTLNVGDEVVVVTPVGAAVLLLVEAAFGHGVRLIDERDGNVVRLTYGPVR